MLRTSLIEDGVGSSICKTLLRLRVVAYSSVVFIRAFATAYLSLAVGLFVSVLVAVEAQSVVL